MFCTNWYQLWLFLKEIFFPFSGILFILYTPRNWLCFRRKLRGIASRHRNNFVSTVEIYWDYVLRNLSSDISMAPRRRHPNPFPQVPDQQMSRYHPPSALSIFTRPTLNRINCRYCNWRWNLKTIKVLWHRVNREDNHSQDTFVSNSDIFEIILFM